MIRWFGMIRLNRIFSSQKIWFGIGQTESFSESYDSEKYSNRITNPNLENFNDKTESRIRITDSKILIPNHESRIIKIQNTESESHPESCKQEITTTNHMIRESYDSHDSVRWYLTSRGLYRVFYLWQKIIFPWK